MIIIRPKEIVGNSFHFLMNKVKNKHIDKILHHIFICALCGFVIYLQIRNYFLKAKRCFERFQRRERLMCKDCELSLCNVMCEKCNHMTEYCDLCYLHLQDKIDRSEILLDDVKCNSCKNVLDYCQKFSYD